MFVNQLLSAGFELPTVQVVVLGYGVVGKALVHRWLPHHIDGVPIEVRAVATSKLAWVAPRFGPGSDPLEPADALHCKLSDSISDVFSASVGARVVIDATASDHVASLHAEWCAAGIHVVTANKQGIGVDGARHLAIRRALVEASVVYGDSTTVGAGLPILNSLRRLRRAGDQIDSVTAVVSGSLAWLLDSFDGSVPFEELVREAQRLGYCEPDPWQDLSGQDVVRKAVIIARAAGFDLEPEDVLVEPLVPQALADHPSRWHEYLADRRAQAVAHSRGLVYCADIRRDGDGVRCQVSLCELPFGNALLAPGTTNTALIHSRRYNDTPLVVQGPGAGADVTAAGLVDDLCLVVDATTRVGGLVPA